MTLGIQKEEASGPSSQSLKKGREPDTSTETKLKETDMRFSMAQGGPRLSSMNFKLNNSSKRRMSIQQSSSIRNLAQSEDLFVKRKARAKVLIQRTTSERTLSGRRQSEQPPMNSK